MWRRTVQGENIPSSQKILLDGDGADHARVIVLNSCARLYTHTHTHAHIISPHPFFLFLYKVKVVPGSMGYTVHGILQARILKWVAFHFSRGSFQPRRQTQVSCIAGGSFPSCGGWAYEHASQCWPWWLPLCSGKTELTSAYCVPHAGGV